MKRTLAVVATSAALTALGQAGQQTQGPAYGSGASHNKSGTVLLQGVDGRTRELAVPQSMAELQGLVRSPGAVDLENRTGGQAGCPVQILQASFDRPAQLMLTSHRSAGDSPVLHLEYQNSSGKDISSVTMTGWLKVKENPYQLDATNLPVRLTLSRTVLLGRDVIAKQALQVVTNAIGFDRIELSEVNYADGTAWSPGHRNCVYANYGTTERAKAW